MIEGPDFAEAAALMGEPARARMLTALLDGRAWTATELALEANVAPSSASVHLARLLEGGLVSDLKQGRHRYFRLASGDVSSAIEALMVLSVRTTPNKRLPGPRDQRMRLARTCYDHLAGSVAVTLFGHMVTQEWLVQEKDSWTLTQFGQTKLAEFLGIAFVDLSQIGKSCLDWSERTAHLGGPLGKALLSLLLTHGLILVGPGRLVSLTELGNQRFQALGQ
jgi:DNA-binding transcriptional ArsR family regulator